MNMHVVGRIVLSEWEIRPPAMGLGPVLLRHQPCGTYIPFYLNAGLTLDEVLGLVQGHYAAAEQCRIRSEAVNHGVDAGR